MVTVKISQKHVERFVFSMIIIVLLGLLINERFTENNNINLTGNSIKDLLPYNDTNINVEKIENKSIEIEEEKKIETTTSTTTTSTTTTTLKEELILLINKVNYEKIDDNKAKIISVNFEIYNGLKENLDLTLKYYLYDSQSSLFEINTPKRPYFDLPTLPPKGKLKREIEIDKFEFNIDNIKTLVLEIEDESKGILESEIIQFKI